jgi:hypothetical protein
MRPTELFHGAFNTDYSFSDVIRRWDKLTYAKTLDITVIVIKTSL